MMHDETHDALLQALVVGDVQETSAEARARLEACATCREQWDGLRAVTSRMRALDDERRGVMRSAAEITQASGADRAERALRDAAAGTVAASKPILPAPVEQARGRRTVRWLVAAALLVGTLLFVREFHSGGRGPNEDIELGPGHIELVSDANRTTGWHRIEWKYDPPPAGRMRLRVEGRSSEGDAWILLYEGTVAGNTWSPTEENRKQWPVNLRCIVSGYDSGDRQVASSGWVSFSLAR